LEVENPCFFLPSLKMSCVPSLAVCFPFFRGLKKVHRRLAGQIGKGSIEVPDFEWDWEDYQVSYRPFSASNFDGDNHDDVLIIFQRPRLRLRLNAFPSESTQE